MVIFIMIKNCNVTIRAQEIINSLFYPQVRGCRSPSDHPSTTRVTLNFTCGIAALTVPFSTVIIIISQKLISNYYNYVILFSFTNVFIYNIVNIFVQWRKKLPLACLTSASYRTFLPLHASLGRCLRSFLPFIHIPYSLRLGPNLSYLLPQSLNCPSNFHPQTISRGRDHNILTTVNITTFFRLRLS